MLVTGGFDYVPIDQTLIFGPGSQAQQCITIFTISDSQTEQSELFEVIATFNGDNIGGSPLYAEIISTNGKPPRNVYSVCLHGVL